MSARGGKKKGKKKTPAWKCAWCPQTQGDKRRGPCGPRTLCRKCNGRWGNGETGPRSADWSCDSCGVQETSRRWKGPKGPGTLCDLCGSRYAKGATGPPAKNWRCDWCPTTTGPRRKGPEGPATLCVPCGGRFYYGKTGPLSETFECRWCDATSTPHRFDGPTGEGELCEPCGHSYAKASDKIKARLVRVETELDRLTSVAVFDVDAGTETRGPPPKHATRHVKIRLKIGGASVQEDDNEMAPLPCALTGVRATGAPLGGNRWGAVGQPSATPIASGGLKALKAATDATAVDLGRVKTENAALEGQRNRNDAVAAAASAAAATANADAAAANDDAEEAQDTLGYQVRFTDALQTKIDELHALARQVDPVAADAIKNRQAT